MVLVGHLNHEALQRATMNTHFTPFEPVWWPGGVDIFFIISGFIMYFIAQDEFGKPGASGNFLIRRLARLVPPYWFFTGLAVLAMTLVSSQMALHSFSIPELAGSLLFVPTANPQGQAFPVLILGWTLNFEMLFYAIFAIGLMFEKARGLIVIHALLLALVIVSLAGPWPLPLGFWANPLVVEFLFGIHIAMARVRGVVWPPSVCIAAIGAGITALIVMQATGIPGTMWLWRFAWAGAPSALLVAGFAFMRVSPRPAKWLKPLVIGGDASFALYLSHPFALSALAMICEKLHWHDTQLYVILGFILCVATAVVIYLIIERPVHRAISRKLPA